MVIGVFYSAPTTTPTTTPIPTTTTPPPLADCPDLTGRWEAVNPNASVCITFDYKNTANLVGLYRNGSDTFWLQLTGKTIEDNFKESGWAVIWPSSSIGVTSFAGQCWSNAWKITRLAEYISRARPVHRKLSKNMLHSRILSDRVDTWQKIPIQEKK